MTGLDVLAHGLEVLGQSQRNRVPLVASQMKFFCARAFCLVWDPQGALIMRIYGPSACAVVLPLVLVMLSRLDYV
ncbi:hypothetical protein L1887_26292 [Cichorium endivia]|nr:hypothetical protein L1887_26292 [Cichorium endivia]